MLSRKDTVAISAGIGEGSKIAYDLVIWGGTVGPAADTIACYGSLGPRARQRLGSHAYGDVGGFGVAAHTDWQVLGTVD